MSTHPLHIYYITYPSPPGRGNWGGTQPSVLTSTGVHQSGWYASYWNVFLFRQKKTGCSSRETSRNLRCISATLCFASPPPKAYSGQNSRCKVQHGSSTKGHRSWDRSILCSFQSRPNCLFPELIKRLALPRAVINPKKPPPPALLTAIRDHLHLVSGTHSSLRSPPPGKLLLTAV